MSPSYLHSDPVQVFDVEQHQTQDPVEVPQGKGFPRDLLTSTCRPQPPSPARLPGHLCSLLHFLVPGLAQCLLHTQCPPQPLLASDPKVPSSPKTPCPSLHVLDVASSHGTHRDGEHSQEEDPAIVEGHLEEVLGTGAAEPQSGQQQGEQQQ